MSDGPWENTDRELWREREGDYYADSIHVTADGRIGINHGGLVVVATLQQWHALARPADQPSAALCPTCAGRGMTHGPSECPDCTNGRIGAADPT